MKCSQPFMRNKSGRVRWSTKMSDEERLDCTPFPCGLCLPCRINKARTWQHRIMLESKSHVESTFSTLTYSDEMMPFTLDGLQTLCKTDFQKFLKRLRRRFDKYGKKIRYFGVGEYGDRSERPHYHVCLFGVGFGDQEIIDDAWRIGDQNIGITHHGTVSPQSARYIAGYTIKKLTSKNDDRLFGRYPEFMLSSRRNPGGIGLEETLRIADELKNNPYFDIDNIINSFQICGKNYPLGGYLSGKLAERLGVSRETIEKRFSLYQDKIFNENKIHTDNYYFNIIDSSDNYRQRLEKKHKIFKKGKKL